MFPLQDTLSLRQDRQQGGQIQAEDTIGGDALSLTAASAGQDPGLKTKHKQSLRQCGSLLYIKVEQVFVEENLTSLITA